MYSHFDREHRRRRRFPEGEFMFALCVVLPCALIVALAILAIIDTQIFDNAIIDAFIQSFA